MTTNSQWKALLEEFMAQENPARKVQMRAYMRNQFDFLGIPSPVRKQIQRPYFAAMLRWPWLRATASRPPSIGHLLKPVGNYLIVKCNM